VHERIRARHGHGQGKVGRSKVERERVEVGLGRVAAARPLQRPSAGQLCSGQYKVLAVFVRHSGISRVA